MCEKEEQRVCIKFCFKIGKTATETFELLKMAYGNDVMGRTQVYEWFGRFSQGRVSCQSDPRSGRPSTSRNPEMVAKVCTLIRNDRRLTIREIAEECDISFGSCETILTKDLNMKRVSAKFVPRLLTEDQQQHRMLTASDLFERACEEDDFMKKTPS